MLSSMAVSSPHTYEPAPTRTSRLKECLLPRIDEPSTPAVSAIAIASRKRVMAVGYSERK